MDGSQAAQWKREHPGTQASTEKKEGYGVIERRKSNTEKHGWREFEQSEQSTASEGSQHLLTADTQDILSQLVMSMANFKKLVSVKMECMKFMAPFITCNARCLAPQISFLHIM